MAGGYRNENFLVVHLFSRLNCRIYSVFSKMNERKAFEEIFREHYTALCNYAAKLVHDTDVAEEIVQDLFVQLLEKNSLDTVDFVDRFLIRSVKFKCIDFLRKRSNSPVVNLDKATENNQIALESEQEVEALFHYLVAKLPPKTQEVFLLVRESGLSYQEAAVKLNISVKTVEAQMSRALDKMRTALKQHGYLSVFYFSLFLK